VATTQRPWYTVGPHPRSSRKEPLQAMAVSTGNRPVRRVLAAAAAAAVGVLAAVPPAAAAGAQVSVGPNVNVSRKPGGQSEQAIAISPRHPQNMVVVSNEDRPGPGLLESISHDGGATWTHRDIATESDGFGFGCCDPSLSWDRYGNLFFGYLEFATGYDLVTILLSNDAGKTWTRLASFRGRAGDTGTSKFQDQPTVTTGGGSVWVTYFLSHRGVLARGARVTGRGKIGVFSDAEIAPEAHPGNYGDVAVGPGGRVMVAYQIPQSGESKGRIRVSLDPDGLGPQGFQLPVNIALTNVGGFDFIPAQSGRSIDAEVGLAWDRSHGPFRGRVYCMYTREDPDESNDMNIWIRHSDDGGATWSAPLRLNGDTGTNSQFLPRIALDQTTGFVAVTWHDARSDHGQGHGGDTDGIPNDDAQFWGTVSVDGGQTFARNVRISRGTSNAQRAQDGVDYGDYTGLAFQAGAFYPAWADNSNSTGDNPDGKLSRFDVYTARVEVSAGP
jgi:hypothetical protein